ncbi:thioesterase domain-containing protein [Lentzea flava]|uniref:Thioesterase domain-containing protein n=1 Tax=Lentzea flava TaxID=103732 RepID=A0ABQ2UMD2_9PSEU|nr:thioesterase domain-containing protein [Lentzea flava]GGU44164.1 hypothetical protein GCM10010178_40940 [Lentzea flava]
MFTNTVPVRARCAPIDSLEGVFQAVQDAQARHPARRSLRPYHVLGWSLGGPMAQAVAGELHSRAHEVGLVGVLDSGPSSYFADFRSPDEGLVRRYLAHYMGHLAGIEEFESTVRTPRLFSSSARS